MWSFLYQVPALAATPRKQFEQQTGQLCIPGITYKLVQCSPLYVQNVSEYSERYLYIFACKTLFGSEC